MSLREKVTESILQYSAISEGKADEQRKFYYKNYEDNLYCPLGSVALEAYDKGSGAETRPSQRNYKGKIIYSPAKMASIVSSSAMTFNLLGNDPIVVSIDNIMPEGKYDVFYEKQMYTLKGGSNPANLDAFLSDTTGKTAVFCEMKFLEWLGTPGMLKDTYLDESRFFAPDNSVVECPVDAYSVFRDVIMKMTDHFVDDKYKKERKFHKSVFTRYDAWQMLKHILSIYNYTSFVTKDSVDSFGGFSSMAGTFDRIVLLNVVNEFPAECIRDLSVKGEYSNAMKQEQCEAETFIDIIKQSKIPELFKSNCKAEFELKYVSAKQFADEIEMSEDKREYLKRYFI